MTIAVYRPSLGAFEALVVPLAALAGCSFTIDVSEVQCQSDQDCLTAGFAGTQCEAEVCVASQSFTGDDELSVERPVVTPFSSDCLGETPVAPDKTSDTVPFTMLVIPPAGVKTEGPVTVRACQRLDPTCVEPELELDDVAIAEAHTLDLPFAFEGYFEVIHPELVPTLVYLNEEVTEPGRVWDLQIPSPRVLGDLAQAASLEADATQGHLVVRVLDCEQTPIAGVHFESKGGGIPFYFLDGFPAPLENSTDDAGYGGFLNVPPGTTTVEAAFGSGDERIDLGKANAVVRSGWLSFVEVTL